MAPADARDIFGFGVLGVVDQEIGVLASFAQKIVERGMAVFEVGCNDNGCATAFDAVAARALWVIERESFNGERATTHDAVRSPQELALCFGGAEIEGEEGIGHLPFQPSASFAWIDTGVEANLSGSLNERGEKGKPLQMIPMKVGKEKVDFGRARIFGEQSAA